MHTLHIGDATKTLLDLAPAHAGHVDALVIDPLYDEGRPSHWKQSLFAYTDAAGDEERRGRSSHAGASWRRGLASALEAAAPLLTADAPVAVMIGHARVHDAWQVLRDSWPQREVIMITVDTGPRAAARGVIHRAEYVLIAPPPGGRIGAPGFTKGETRTGWSALTLSSFDSHTYPNQAYPIWVDGSGRILGAGPSLAEDPAAPAAAPDGAVEIWPVTRTGRRVIWRIARGTFDGHLRSGWLRADRPHMPGNPQGWVIKQLASGVRSRINAGEIAVHGRDANGALLIDRTAPAGTGVPTIWTGGRYASRVGTARLKELVGNVEFAYPKPPGLVEDIIRALDLPHDATVLDCFAGTGTLADSLAAMNAQDGGSRRAILIERDPRIADICRRRLHALPQTSTAHVAGDGVSRPQVERAAP